MEFLLNAIVILVIDMCSKYLIDYKNCHVFKTKRMFIKVELKGQIQSKIINYKIISLRIFSSFTYFSPSLCNRS